MPDPTHLSRRKTLGFIALSATGGVMLSSRAFASGAGDLLLAQSKVCVITPQTTEGPFYFDPDLERADITEGKPGLPADIRLQIVDENCRPLAGARVDIWHCDASGLYSGYVNRTERGAEDAQGETFLRGTQFAADDGTVTFNTIYPGWYQGRTPHIHFKIFVGENSALTGQMFFPDGVSDRVYTGVSPYNERGQRDRSNQNDAIARRAGDAAMAEVEELPEKYVASLIIGLGSALPS